MSVLRYVTPTLPPRVNPVELAETFHEKHPKAARFLELTGQLTDGIDIQIFKELL